MQAIEHALNNIPSTISTLEVRGLEWPEPMTLKLIVKAAPQLCVLIMRQPMIWCGLCNTCSISELKEPIPKSIMYENGVGLPVSNLFPEQNKI